MNSRDFSVEIDSITKEAWHDHLSRFSDANIYQTWAYGAVSWGERNLSHLVLKKAGEVAAMAQLRIIKIPLLKRGIAYLRWGPVCRLSGTAADGKALSAMIRAIKVEYAERRRLVVRIVPNRFEEEPEGLEYLETCAQAGFRAKTGTPGYRTIRVPLAGTLEELRKRLDQKWRNQLNGAGRNGLNIIEGTSEDLFNKFVQIYDEMMARKRFETSVDIKDFRKIQQQLPTDLKMPILLCEKDGKVMAGIIGTAIGETGIYLHGATSDEGMKSKGSYLLQWRMMQLLRERGCRWYDLGGINPEKNPGVYHFKAGFGGQDIRQCNVLELSGSHGSFLCVSVMEKFKRFLERFGAVLPRHKVGSALR